MRKLVGYVLIVAWPSYVGVTCYVLWRIVSGDTPSFLSNYTLGTNAAWVMLGFMLVLATAWTQGFDNR